MINASMLALAATLILACLLAWQALRLRGSLARERADAATRMLEREALVREQATAAERERIYNDLHDDLGARLLGLVHGAHSPQQADQARALLQDLRDVVTRSRGTPGTLGDVLADIRSETEQRLRAVDIGLDWQCPDALPDPEMDTYRALHLHRIVREAISNVIRHAQARVVRMRIGANGQQLHLELTDDGSGAGVEPKLAGRGLDNMRERAAELDGRIHWRHGTAGGTKVLLCIPLESSP